MQTSRVIALYFCCPQLFLVPANFFARLNGYNLFSSHAW
jgi:hypothetical protein